MKNSDKKLIFMIIIICAVFLRLLSLFVSDNFHGIAAGKILEAQRLLEHPDRLYAWVVPAHGPIHMYLIAFVLKISGDVFMSPRLISLFFGISLLFVYYDFLRLSFDDNIAIVGMFMLAFFPLHIMHSVLSTAGTMFLFFIFAGLSFFIKYQNDKRLNYIIFSAILFSIASMCRFEGGLYIAIVAFLLFGRWRDFFCFIGVASIFPLIWMYCNHLYSGDFMYFLNNSDVVVKMGFSKAATYGKEIHFFDRIVYWPLQIVSYFGWPVFFLGFAGFILHGFRRGNRKVAWLFIMILTFFILKTIGKELALQPRYGLTLSLLFIPYAVMGFFYILRKIQVKAKSRVLGLIFVLYIIFRSTYVLALILPHTPAWVKQTGAFLKKNVKPGELVYIKTNDDNSREPLKLYSQLELNNFIDYDIFLRDSFNLRDLQYIVFIGDGKLSKYKDVFSEQNCTIYEVDFKGMQENEN
ncbi:MAG: glycosyltransferase family 39 protein [PVC group bacterium]|nr:glycosyltransferase family 39 protein [PVC group bacterium]